MGLCFYKIIPTGYSRKMAMDKKYIYHGVITVPFISTVVWTVEMNTNLNVFAKSNRTGQLISAAESK